MRLIIQIPCYNEAATLETTIRALPRKIDGIDEIQLLVIDDGSADDTAEEAVRLGVDHVVRHPRNLGLARAFTTGLATALELGADLIVNTDADNQYCADDIPKLLEPLIAGRAELVIGTRPIRDIDHFSPTKKQLQRLGSWVVRKVSGVDVEDAPSGFRAMTRAAASRFNVFSSYTYTIETIVQAGQAGMAVECVPVRVNEDLRPSRLVSSIPSYIRRTMVTLFRIAVTYRPMRFFVTVGAALIGVGALLGLRFLVYFAMGEGEGHIQSLILTAILITVGFQTCVLGVVADLISVNRRLMEDVQRRTRQGAGNGNGPGSVRG